MHARQHSKQVQHHKLHSRRAPVLVFAFEQSMVMVTTPHLVSIAGVRLQLAVISIPLLHSGSGMDDAPGELRLSVRLGSAMLNTAVSYLQ